MSDGSSWLEGLWCDRHLITLALFSLFSMAIFHLVDGESFNALLKYCFPPTYSANHVYISPTLT